MAVSVIVVEAQLLNAKVAPSEIAAVGTAFTTTTSGLLAALSHPSAFVITTVKLPGKEVVYVCDVAPTINTLLLYHLYPLATEAVKVTTLPAQIELPEEVIDGAVGVAGCEFIVTDVATLVHPELFFTVTEYVPDVTLVNNPVVFV